jgi:glycosyltransferase involved in cell wall biosynthesis
MSDAPAEIRALGERRAAARAAGDYEAADALREQIAAAGWTVVDEPAGWRLEPAMAEAPVRMQASAVRSVLDDDPIYDVSLQWVVEGWPQDVRRAIEGFRATAGGRRLQFVVAELTGADGEDWGEDVEVIRLQEGTGWAAARNAGLRRSRGRLVLVLDGSIEPAGDVLAPLEEALADPGVGVCGPFGVITHDLREFDPAPEAGDCDAVEGYLMALRRDVLILAGPFDEKFRWYRMADIDWSFRVKDVGLRAVVVPVPVTKHEHRMWFETPPAQRASWSKRNFYRFLDRWRDRWDLVLSGEPSPGPEGGEADA